MTYKLVLKQDAEKEWRKLDATIKKHFKKKLIERLENPRVESARLNGMKDCYKIKLRSAGYRLVYQVRDMEVLVSIVAVGKRDRNQVYNIAVKRI
ncbi:MAG: type II toxin-antitoxin system RelE/ParE family toxin [Gammaproteobacteria bacterium]|nr:type II toxin-antitoxin system RelE/ParE family toxin [Gammaproteobacteria bacterium]